MGHDFRYVDFVASTAFLARSALAWTEAGGSAEYHLLAPFKEDGHFLVDYLDSVPVWSPIVMKFLGRHPGNGLATK